MSEATDTQTASITLEWQAPLNSGGVPLTGFKLYSWTDIEGEVLQLDATNHPEILSFTVAGLTIDVDYTFYVSALNPYEGPRSDSATFRTGGRPSRIMTMTRLFSQEPGQRLGLQWPEPDSNGSPILFYSLAIVEENSEDVIVYHGQSPLAYLEDLSVGQTYTFRVKSLNLVGDSEYSPSFTYLIVSVPSAPINLQLVSFTNLQVELAWEQPLQHGG